ncbi:MAG: hypothetical protein AAF614_37555 [Chloroflexota bacterium]
MKNYEFTSEQNAKIDRLRHALLRVGIFFLINGLLPLITYVVAFDYFSGLEEVLMVTSILLFAAMGIVFLRPLDNLKKIVTTIGSDIKEMMQAIVDLRVAFTVACVVLVLMIISINVDSVRLLLR